MLYNLIETNQAINDVANLAIYIFDHFKSPDAARKFISLYEKRVENLKVFPKGFRGISIEFRGYEIKIYPFSTYNIFFVVDEENYEIIILRVLKDLQNWQDILRKEQNYDF